MTPASNHKQHVSSNSSPHKNRQTNNLRPSVCFRLPPPPLNPHTWISYRSHSVITCIKTAGSCSGWRLFLFHFFLEVFDDDYALHSSPLEVPYQLNDHTRLCVDVHFLADSHWVRPKIKLGRGWNTFTFEWRLVKVKYFLYETASGVVSSCWIGEHSLVVKRLLNHTHEKYNTSTDSECCSFAPYMFFNRSNNTTCNRNCRI